MLFDYGNETYTKKLKQEKKYLNQKAISRLCLLALILSPIYNFHDIAFLVDEN